ncbi:MAG: hypothetical protein ACPGN3_09855 [Opitutales bacterium]
MEDAFEFIGLDEEIEALEETLDSVDEILEDPLKFLRDKLESFKDLVLKELPTQIGASLEYAYNYTRSEDTLLEANVDRTKILGYGKDLLLLDIRKLVEDSKDAAAGVSLKRYSFQESIKESWSVSLSVGLPFGFNFGQSWSDQDLWTTRKISTPAGTSYQHGFHGIHGVSLKDNADWGVLNADWSSELVAITPRALAGAEARLSGFEFRLEISAKMISPTSLAGRLLDDETHLLKSLDIGVLFGAITDTNVRDYLSGLKDKEPKVSQIEQAACISKIVIDHDTLSSIAKIISDLSDSDYVDLGASAAARAVLCWPKYKIRCDSSFRERAYFSAMQKFLKDGKSGKKSNLKAFAKLIKQSILSVESGKYGSDERERLAKKENTPDLKKRPTGHGKFRDFTSKKFGAGIIYQSDTGRMHLPSALSDLRKAMSQIVSPNSPLAYHRSLEKLDDQIGSMLGSVYGARVLVSLLGIVMRDYDIDTSSVKRSFKIKGEIAGDKKTISLS